jgi:protein transport protein SEC13
MSIIDQLKLYSEELDTKETIFDLNYDWYGKRLAAITSDRKILMYRKQDNGKWEKYNEFSGMNGHLGPVWKIKWAHEFLGSIVATCSPG